MRTYYILLFIIISACHPLYCNWDLGYEQLKEMPSQEQLTGKYTLSPSSVEFLKDKNFTHDEYSLILSANKEFEFRNGPDLIFDRMGNSQQILFNKEGKYYVSCAESYDCLIELEGVCVVPIATKQDKLAILITIGDGDNCDGLVYEKSINM